MATHSKSQRSAIIPCFAYQNAPDAIDWLCQVFGFERHAVYPGPDDTISHAELRLGDSMIMCGSKNDGPFGRWIKQPNDLGGCETQAPYVIVSDADAIYERARAAGAEILIDIKDESYGGRGFTCRDLEGHIWTFGTYDPLSSEKAG